MLRVESVQTEERASLSYSFSRFVSTFDVRSLSYKDLYGFTQLFGLKCEMRPAPDLARFRQKKEQQWERISKAESWERGLRRERTEDTAQNLLHVTG
jgi:hypothetical protein